MKLPQTPHRINVAQLMVQRDHAARVWEREHPGKPAHFEMDGDDYIPIDPSIMPTLGDRRPLPVGVVIAVVLLVLGALLVLPRDAKKHT